ncbi:MAG: S8 family serine peptidase [Rhizobiales bacterium]|nr:S8 family serine peptidase [Hyphomicrobiales bacterium]
MTVQGSDRTRATQRGGKALAGLVVLFLGTTSLVVADTRPAAAQFGIGLGGLSIPGVGNLNRRPSIARPSRVPNVNMPNRMPNMRGMTQGQRMPGGMERFGRNPDMAIGRDGRIPGQGRMTEFPGRGGRMSEIPGRGGRVGEFPGRGGRVGEIPGRGGRIGEIPGRGGRVTEIPGRPGGRIDVPGRVPGRGPNISVGGRTGGPLPPGGGGGGGGGGLPPGGGGFGGGGGAGFAAAAAAAVIVPAAVALIQAARAGDRAVVDDSPPGLPPPTERRYMAGEVLFVMRPNAPEADIQRVVRRFNLRLISEERSELIGTSVHRYRVPNGQDVPAAIRAMTRDARVAYVQPNYLFERPNYVYRLQSSTTTAAGGAALQYVVDTLRLPEAHLLSNGAHIPIAVIDSGIDANHPEIVGRITKRFDAVGGPFQAHEHGTGMAGAIIAHAQLIGVSPRADILAARAFAPGQAAGASGTSFHILKAMDWSIREGARVINMSFAGPRDPMMTRAIQVAAERRIAMIAAMGNEGPNAPISFPAADPNVIAVTAVDQGGRIFDQATRGDHVAVAAPGVEVLLPAPQGGYQISSGTSVAAAHVSGIAALILERSPNLDPAALRQILRETARRTATPDPQLGAGLADPVPAINAAQNPPQPEAPAPMAVAPAPAPETAAVAPPQAAPRQATVDPKPGKE